MSFASDAKSELCVIADEERCCKRAVLAGLISFCARKSKDSIKITTENVAVGRLVVNLIKSLFNIKPDIKITKRSNARMYVIVVNDAKKMLSGLGLGGTIMRIHPAVVKNECCRSAFVRGTFLGGGSISSPKKSYHLEISTRRLTLRNDFKTLLSSFGINMKSIERNGSHVFYFKGSEQISDMLALMGAHTTMMEFLNVKIIKEMRNNVNRIMNCESANVNKIISASLEQKQAIEKINTRIGLDVLPTELEQLAWLRLENTDLSLKELGEKCNPPLNKSAVNRRMKKIIEYSKQI